METPMRLLTTAAAPTRHATGAGSALPMVAAALGFGAGANIAVGCLVAAVVAASRSGTLDLSSAALRLAADAGLGLATGLAVGLFAALAVLAGHCFRHGRPHQGSSAGRFCRAAVPATAGAGLGLLTAAWLLARVVGFAEGGTVHALGVAEPSTVVLIALALVTGMGWRAFTGLPRGLGDLVRRLGPSDPLQGPGPHPHRFAALATLSVAVLTVCGLVVGWSAPAPSPKVSGAKSLVRPVTECPERSADRPAVTCAGADCQATPRPAVGTARGPGASPRRAS
jgi:hypothetical protein